MFEIKRVYNDFFEKKGFVLDDAYDLVKRNYYIKYFKEHLIEYIKCQDISLDNLMAFIDLKYLSISQDAENINILSEMKELVGLELYSEQLCRLPKSVRDSLQSVVLFCHGDKVDEVTSLKNLEKLKFDGFPGFNHPDLYFIKDLRLKHLSIASRYLRNLDGVEYQTDLEALELSSCSKLSDFSHLGELKKLKRLRICECNQVTIPSTDFPASIESLSVLGNESTAFKNHFSSVDFLFMLPNLNFFETNWRVSPKQIEIIKKLVPRVVVY